MTRALTWRDIGALDTVLVALMEAFSPAGSGIDDTDEPKPPLIDPTEETFDTIDRLRIDGKVVARTERVVHEGKTLHKLHFPFSGSDFPGGPRNLCAALVLRMAQLSGEPVPDDERNELAPEAAWATIERLAASIEVVEPAETVH